MPFNGGEITVPKTPVHEVIWEHLRQHGYSTAIVDASLNGKSITFMEWYDSSRKVAAYLQSWGVKKGDFVSICAPGCMEFAYVMIGILGSGAVVAPCNPSYTKSEILQQFDISRPRVAFVDQETVETMKMVKESRSFLEKIVVFGQSKEFNTIDEILAQTNPETLTIVDIDSENDAAFAPHSSGTTGLPKCAIMTHKSYVAWLTIGFSERTDTQLSTYCDRPMYHSGGFAFILMNAVTGTRSVIDRNFQIDRMLKNIEEYKIDMAIAVPPMQIEMANAKNIDQYDLSSLKMILGGGAAQSPDIIQRLIKKYKVKFITAYGMTETGSISLALISEGERSNSAGKIRKGAEVKITNISTDEECAIGSDGEIRVRSAQVTKGYLKNPAANAVAFDQDGWFKTGDFGHLDEDGNLYVVDRLKEIIKYKTIQVSPAELESVILGHPKVADVGVVGVPNEPNGEVPKAFVVRSEETLTAEDVHGFVNEKLVEYKHLRGGVEFVNSIPKSEMGKIQRKLLKKMAGFE